MIRERGGRGEVVEETGEGNKGEREIEDERKGEGEKRRRRADGVAGGIMGWRKLGLARASFVGVGIGVSVD